MTELENYLMDKTAEASGTHLMPVSAPQLTDRNPNPARTIPKVAEQLSTNEEGVSGEQIEKLPQAAPIKVHVDVTGKDAPAPDTLPKEAHIYALPSFSRYPLDSYAQVKTAAQYFDQNGELFAVPLRREYCQNLVKRANDLGISLTDRIKKYGSDHYAYDAQVKAAMDMRRGVILNQEHRLGLDYLETNRSAMQPEDFAVALGEFDKVAGIDHLYDRDIYDPFYTTFGAKTAEDDGAILVGNDYISQGELKAFARTDACKLESFFGKDFVDDFRKDPVAITKSLPVDQKKIVLRLASSTLTDPTTT